MSVTNIVFGVLEAFTVSNLKSGLVLEELAAVVNYKIQADQLEYKVSNTQLLSLLEMHLRSSNTEYAISRSRGRTVIRGLSFKKGTARDFVDTVSTGLMTSPETAKYADDLYKKVLAGYVE